MDTINHQVDLLDTTKTNVEPEDIKRAANIMLGEQPICVVEIQGRQVKKHLLIC